MDADERRDDATGQSGESPLDTPAEEQAWDEAMHQAASLARAQGNAPGAVEETIRQAHRSILDWRSLLRRYMTDAARRDYGWSVPNRRFIDSGLYLPSMHSEGIDAIAIIIDTYDAYAGAFKVIHANIEEALKATGIVQGEDTLNKNAKSAALSAFEGTKQRFFGHLLTGMKCPSLIRAVEADLDAGRSAVVQLVSTGEALMERRISEIPASEWDDLHIDLTPRDGILSFLMHAFPVQLQEPFTDDDGNLMSRPATDADGNPVVCKEAEEQRDALIEKLAALPPVPTASGRPQGASTTNDATAIAADAAHMPGSAASPASGRNRTAPCRATPAGSHSNASSQNPFRAIHPRSSMA